MFLSRSDRYEYRLYRRNRRRRRLTFFLLVVLALYVAAAWHHGNAHTARQRHATVPRTASPSPHASPAGKRHTATADTTLSWTDFHGIALPVSAQDGPRHTRAGLAWGFTDTRRGALLAAVNIAVRTAAQWGPAVYQPTIHNQITGPDAGALLKADASDYAALRAAAHVQAGQPAGRGYAAETAYRFTAWTAAAATVDIVTEGPGSGSAPMTAVTRIRLTWQHGDWRVIAPPGGNWANSATTAASLTGYTTFPGER
jgi:hypothetical protein